MSDDVDRPGAASQGQPDTEGSPGQPSVRRVVDPDLLWVESVTERLLGSHESPTWERATIGDQVASSQAAPGAASDAAPADLSSSATSATTGTSDAAHQPGATVLRLPIRTPRAPGRPLSYAEALAERPRVRLTETPPPVPYFAPSAEDAPPAGPTAEEVDPPASSGGTAEAATPPPARGTDEAMPASLLRAALRDALPDDTARRPSPVDAIFGDRSWHLPPEPEAAPDERPEDLLPAAAAPPPSQRTPTEPAPTPQSAPPQPAAQPAPQPAPLSAPLSTPLPERTVPPADLAPSAPHLRPSAPPAVAEPEPVEPEPAPVPVPVQVPVVAAAPTPPAPDPVAAPAPAAAAAEPSIPAEAHEPEEQTHEESGSGRHRTHAGGNPDIDAIRMALRSGDEGLAAAVLSLIADRGRERERLRLVEAYLDAVIAEGDEGLSGAARLRRLLGE